jgi:hypothetical protein
MRPYEVVPGSLSATEWQNTLEFCRRPVHWLEGQKISIFEARAYGFRQEGALRDNVGEDRPRRNMTAMSTMENKSSAVGQDSGMGVSK